MATARRGVVLYVGVVVSFVGAVGTWVACSSSSSSGGGSCNELTSCCPSGDTSVCAAIASGGVEADCESGLALYCASGSAGGGGSQASSVSFSFSSTHGGSSGTQSASLGSQASTSGGGASTSARGGLCTPCASDGDCVSADRCIYDGESGNYYCAPLCSDAGACDGNLVCDGVGEDIDASVTNDYSVCYPASNTCDEYDGGS